MKKKTARSIPSVERVLQALGPTELPRPSTLELVRRRLQDLRENGGDTESFDDLVDSLREEINASHRTRIQAVINGTGVIVHTNLGRAPLGEEAVRAVSEAAANYSTIEYDLARGERGSRAGYLESHLALLCQAEAAMVVNNCAAALILVLQHLTSGERKEVVLSRGELVQIGGGFRIPEILETSGAVLREVGTTNRTDLKDYARAIGKGTAMILRVHRSNFFMEGFVSSPSTDELAALARKKKIPLVEDLGSGAMADTARLASVDHEPTPAEVLKRGVHLVCFSGDKLMGGPQAGIIAGKARLVAALKKEPFYRALRCDKLVLAGLQAVVDSYLRGGDAAVPVLRLIRSSLKELGDRANRLALALEALPMKTTIGDGQSQIGGGSLPRSVLPSITLEMRPLSMSVQELSSRLRRGAVPVITYIAGGRLKVDLRTVFPHQDETLFKEVYRAFGVLVPADTEERLRRSANP